MWIYPNHLINGQNWPILIGFNQLPQFCPQGSNYYKILMNLYLVWQIQSGNKKQWFYQCILYLHVFILLTLILKYWKVWPMLKFSIIIKRTHVSRQQNKIVLSIISIPDSISHALENMVRCTCSSAWPIFVQIIYALCMCLNISVVNEGHLHMTCKIDLRLPLFGPRFLHMYVKLRKWVHISLSGVCPWHNIS